MCLCLFLTIDDCFKKKKKEKEKGEEGEENSAVNLQHGFVSFTDEDSEEILLGASSWFCAQDYFGFSRS